MSQEPNCKRKNIWINIIFFIVTTAVTVVGVPLYLWKYGVGVAEMSLFAFYVVATGLGITVGYHRYFSHATFKAHPIMKFLFLFFGAAAFEQPALMWSSQHRDHHQYVDTEKDPYSIKKGFFYAHLGWLVFWEHEIHYENAKDLQRDKMVMHQHKYYLVWSVFAGIILPILIGAMTGHALAAFIFSVCARLTLVYHSTFCINSVCHMFGKSTYDIYATAKDHWLVALITFGEGYHNFHHRFPSDYRNGVRWYQWDPSKWLIAFCSFFGLTSDLRRVSTFRILEAKLLAEKKKASDLLEKREQSERLKELLTHLKEQYDQLRLELGKWEAAYKESQQIYGKWSYHSQEIKNKLIDQMEIAKQSFELQRHKWKKLIRYDLKLMLAY